MTKDEAIALVAQKLSTTSQNMVAHEIDDFPELYYIAIRGPKGEQLIGGEAYVVDIDSRTVYPVSGSVPPEDNCLRVREIRQSLAR